MKQINFTGIFLITIFLSQAAIGEDDNLCRHLTRFAQSVAVNETAVIELHTSWGANFKDDPEEALTAKRCIHNNFPAGKAVCKYLMKNSSTEFSGINFKNILLCLDPKTKIDSDVYFNMASVSFSFGTDSRGALIELSLEKDENIGGMVLKLEADGY